jgi:tetraacyldisaccharide 4'-kinase
MKKILADIATGKKDPGLLYPLLSMAELAYGAAVEVRNLLYDKSVLSIHKTTCKVIGVGNITAGGNGKTPFVELLAGKLGGKCAVVSGGYGSLDPDSLNIVSDGTKIISAPPPVSADEAYLLAKRLPTIAIITCKKRIVAVNEAVDKFGVDTVILDDAFQHRKLARDIDILLLNLHKPFANGHLLPLGTLRENISGCERAGIIVATSTGQATEAEQENFRLELAKHMAAKKPIAFAEGNISRFIDSVGTDIDVSGRPVFALCGIARPERFIDSLRNAGANVTGSLFFPDHHMFSEDDVIQVEEKLKRSGAEYIVTTQKDFTRLEGMVNLLSTNLLVAEYVMKISSGEKELDQLLAGL